MNTDIKGVVKAFMLGFGVLAVSAATTAYAETEQQTKERMTKEAKDTADKVEKAEKEKSGGDYEVKKSHDEHIKATEKPAADSQKK